MKIVFLSYLHGFGGAERQNVMLANEMAKRGHDVSIVSISADNLKYDLDSRIKYVFLPDRSKSIMRVFFRYMDINNILKKIRPDVVINFWFQTAYMTALMKKNITGKLIYAERGDPSDKEYDGILGMVRKFITPRIDGFVFQSKGAQSCFDESVINKSIVIQNALAINPDEFSVPEKKRHNIVTIGRLHAQKNHKLLIDAFSEVVKKYPEYTLEIYGDGELKIDLEHQISQLGLAGNVFLYSACSDVHSRIVDSELFVLSSDYEGLPNTLMEAMALGLPCISTDCRPGGARELIDNKRSGLIVPVDDVNALKNAILTAIKNKDIMKSYGFNAAKSSKRFLSKVIYDEWNKFIVGVKYDN